MKSREVQDRPAEAPIGVEPLDAEAAEAEDPQARLAAIGEIAAEIAHELRNALQVISANVYLARQTPEKSDAQLAKIERNARLAHSIVDDLLALARRERLRAEPTSLQNVLDDARADLPEPLAIFQDALEPRNLEVHAHHGLLVRLFRVLFDNATLASAPRRPTIRVRANREASGVVIDVQDDGPGVAEGIAGKIFEPLVSGRPNGTGLGLALARRIAEAHGGAIRLAPSEGGTGARFRIELPNGG